MSRRVFPLVLAAGAGLLHLPRPATRTARLGPGALPVALRAPTLAVALSGATFGLYMVAAGRSYDYDSSETVRAFVATPSLLDPLRRQLGYNNQPLFSFLEHLVYSGGGHTEAALRVLPCAFGAVAVGVLAGWLGRRFGLLAGLSAGLLMAAEPLFATESRSVRGYSLVTLCGVVSTLVLVRMLERPRRLTQAGYVLAVGAGVATHLYMLAVVLGHVAAIVVAKRPRLLAAAALGVVLGAATYSGLAAAMIRYSRGQQGHFQSAFPRVAARALLGERPLAILCFALLALLGLLLLRRRAVLAAAAAIALALVLDWALVAPRDLYPRFLVWLVPAFAALSAPAVRRFPATVLIAAAAIALMIDLDQTTWAASPLPSRQAAAEVVLLAGRGDRVCAFPFTTGALMAYLPRLPPEVSSPGELTPCDAIVALAVGPRRLLVAAAARFPYLRVLPALTPMVIRCRRPCPR